MNKKTKKTAFLKYVIFGVIIIGTYILFYLNGLNLIEEYPAEIGGIILLGISKLASKWFGWNLSFLLKDEVKNKVGKAIITAERKAIKKAKTMKNNPSGKDKNKWAIEILNNYYGIHKAKGKLLIAMMFPKFKKQTDKLWITK